MGAGERRGWPFLGVLTDLPHRTYRYGCGGIHDVRDLPMCVCMTACARGRGQAGSHGIACEQLVRLGSRRATFD